MGTTTAAMILVDEGRLELDAPVVRYLPWWSGGHAPKETVTVRQLLLHRGGLPPFRRFFLEMEGREAFQQAIAELPLDYAPGDSTVYSDIGMMTVAWAIEEITGEPLDRFLGERVWAPLGMQDTGFRPDSALHGRVAPTEIDADYRGVHVRGVVHDENAYAVGGVAGHAGLFSSARDVAVFAAMMLGGGRAGPCDGTEPTPPAAHPERGPSASSSLPPWTASPAGTTPAPAAPPAGTPLPATPRRVASSRGAPSATPASRGRRSGSTPSSTWPWCCS